MSDFDVSAQVEALQQSAAAQGELAIAGAKAKFDAARDQAEADAITGVAETMTKNSERLAQGT